MAENEFDVIVIGTGVAGQTAAEELAAAGKRVAVVECREVGGTCALRGCEPKKALFSIAEASERARAHLGDGVTGCGPVQWSELLAFKRTFTDDASEAITGALTGSGVSILRGVAVFSDPSTIVVDGTRHSADHIVVATGARSRPLGIPGEELVLTSEQFMAAESIGPRVVFIGGGYVSFEFAHIADATGARVTIVHRGERVLDGFEPRLATMLADSYRARGIDIMLGAPVAALKREGGGLAVLLGDGSRIECDTVVHGAGRIPDLEALDLSAGGVAFGPRGIEVDDALRSTSNPRVWAAGDAAALGPPLTPVGIAQARVIVRQLLGDTGARFRPPAVPSVVFSDPPLARVGLTEASAAEKGLDVDVRFTDMSGWASSRRAGVTAAGASILVARDTGMVVGAHLLGPHADEMINVLATAIMGGVTAGELKSAIWAYPTSGYELVYLL